MATSQNAFQFTRSQRCRTADKPSLGAWERKESFWRMSVTTLEVVALVVLPVAAACSLGLLARSLINAHGELWPLWLVLLAATTAL